MNYCFESIRIDVYLTIRLRVVHEYARNYSSVGIARYILNNTRKTDNWSANYVRFSSFVFVRLDRKKKRFISRARRIVLRRYSSTIQRARDSLPPSNRASTVCVFFRLFRTRVAYERNYF